LNVISKVDICFLPEEAEMRGMITKLFRFKILKIRFEE
jgi:hypothetical protein